MIDYFRNYSGNAHHVCYEDSPTKGLYDHCQSDGLALHTRSQVRLKRDYFLTDNISDNIEAVTLKRGLTPLGTALNLTVTLKTFERIVPLVPPPPPPPINFILYFFHI